MGEPKERKEKVFQGEAVSKGIAFATIHVAARGFAAPEVYSITEHLVPAERERFRRALERTKDQLATLRHQIEAISGEAEGRKMLNSASTRSCRPISRRCAVSPIPI